MRFREGVSGFSAPARREGRARVGYRATQTKNEGRKGRACQLGALLKGNARDARNKRADGLRYSRFIHECVRYVRSHEPSNRPVRRTRERERKKEGAQVWHSAGEQSPIHNKYSESLRCHFMNRWKAASTWSQFDAQDHHTWQNFDRKQID